MKRPASMTEARLATIAFLERQRVPRACRCVDTGETYESFNQAARMGAIDATAAQVIRRRLRELWCLRNTRAVERCTWGMRWRLVDVRKAP